MNDMIINSPSTMCNIYSIKLTVEHFKTLSQYLDEKNRVCFLYLRSAELRSPNVYWHSANANLLKINHCLV